jgi:hypothetical protein
MPEYEMISKENRTVNTAVFQLLGADSGREP